VDAEVGVENNSLHGAALSVIEKAVHKLLTRCSPGLRVLVVQALKQPLQFLQAVVQSVLVE
jgi:hypothetical protein